MSARASTPKTVPTLEQLRSAPKVLLHDHLDGGHLDGGHLDGGHLDGGHLDGGLRPVTVVEVAAENGYAGLPTTDPAELGAWFRENADAGSLPG